MAGKITSILIDVDDCILPNNGEVNVAFFVGLQSIAERIQDAPYPIAFCTGREYTYTLALANVLGRPNSWSVVESGAFLFNPARRISVQNPLQNPSLTPEIQEAFETARARVLALCEKLPLVFYRGKLINIALELAEGAETTIEDCYLRVQEELRELEEGGFLTINHSSIAVDISPAGIDKASGVRFLSQHTGIDLSQTLGIGDSRGDFPMFELVGQVGCPANASPECKELVLARGGYVAPRPYASGVARVIRHFTEG